MSVPYTYLLKHNPTGTYYYGCRYAIGCNPSEFWTKYKTSSKHVHKLINEYGIDSFSYEIRKTFNSKDDARIWEHKVLRRIKAVNRKDFINMTDNISISSEAASKGSRNRTISIEQRERCRQMGLSNIGKQHSEEINKSKGHPNNKFKLGKTESVVTRQKKRLSKLGKPSNAIGNYQPKCSCLLCHKELTSGTIRQHLKYKHS